MIKNNTVYDGRYAHTDINNAHNKIVLNCINENDIYCVNNINNKDLLNTGIIAGMGSNKEIKFVLQVNLEKDKGRAKVHITSLNHGLTAPAVNQGIFLDKIQANHVYSLDITYNFGVKIKKELTSRHEEYYNSELKKQKNNIVIIANKNKGRQF